MEESKYKAEDCCYIIDSDNRIKHCKVVRVFSANNKIIYQVRTILDWRYIYIDQKYCADTKALLKGVRRKQNE